MEVTMNRIIAVLRALGGAIRTTHRRRASRMSAMRNAALAVAIAAGLPTAAHAEPERIAVDPGADWQHAPTGIRLPPTLNGLQRDRITSFLAGDNNIGSTYFSPSEDEILSIYIYRSGSYDVSMMMDATAQSIFANDRLGTVDTSAGLYANFGDAMIGEGSGLRTTYPVEGPFRSTGLAMFQRGDWLIKLRMSSKTGDAATLDKRLALIAAGLPLSPAAGKAPPAYRIAPCEDARALPKARRRDLEMTDWLLSTTAISLLYDSSETAASFTPADAAGEQGRSILCRDASSQPGRMAYRHADSGEPYAIVFGDSGVVASVGSIGFADENANPRPILLTLGNGMRTQFYRAFETMPPFEQMLEAVNDEGFLAVVERTGDGSTISLPMGD